MSVLGSPSDIRMQPCESVANHPLPCVSEASLEEFQISSSNFGTMSMHRRFRAYEFLTTVTEGVDHGVHTVLIWLSFLGDLR